MKGLVFTGRGALELRDVPEPGILGADEVRVEIAMTGICGTDCKVFAGKFEATPGTVLGHEGAGTIVDIGTAVENLNIGDRVVINPTQSCLICKPCRMGRYCYCENFFAYQVGLGKQGTFTKYVNTLSRWVYPIPDTMSWEVAALIEPFGCSLNGVLRAQVEPWESVLVIGSGPIGMMCQLIAGRTAAVVCATEPGDYRREFASRTTHHSIHPEQLTPKAIKGMTGDRGFDVVIDAVGNQLEAAVALLNKGGRAVAMGCDDDYRASVAPLRMIDDGLSVLANVVQHDAIGPALALAPQVPALRTLVTDVVDLDNFDTAFTRTMGLDPLSGAKGPITCMKAAIRS